MRRHWTAAGMLEAKCHFRLVNGHRYRAKLTAVIHCELHPTEEAATVQASGDDSGRVAQHRDDGGRAGKLSDRSAGSVARATALALCSSDAMTLISTS